MVQTPYRYYDIPDEYLDPWYIPYVNQSNQVDADVHLLYQRVDNIVGTIGTVGAPGDLRQVVGVNGAMALARGFSADADGGGGMFFWSLGSATDDGGTIIVPVGSPPGFWRRLTDGTTFSLRWYGASSSTPDCSGLLLALLTTIGSAPATIVLPNERGATSTPYTFLADVAIPSHVRVRFEPGTRLHIDDGVTVTWAHADQIDAAPNQRIFSFAGSGALRFTGGGTTYLPWTGAAGNGSTDDTPALTALVTALDGTAGTIVLPNPSVAFRFSTDKTWTLTDVTRLTITGAYPWTPVQVNAQLWFFSGEARAATTLAANVTRGDQTITLTSATGIQRGDLVWIYTNVDGETSWHYKKTDTAIVQSVAGNDVTLETRVNFSYNTSDDGQSVTIYRPASITMRDLSLQFYTATTRLVYRGIRGLHFERVRMFDADQTRDLTPLECSRCVDTVLVDVHYDGFLYATAVNFCRNFRADRITVSNCYTSIEPATFSDGVIISRMYATNCTSAVQSHPAFNVTFSDVISYNTSTTGGLQAMGVTLHNVYMYSSVASGVGPAYLHSVLLVDASIYNDYDVEMVNVHYDFPNWVGSSNSNDAINIAAGRRFVADNITASWLNFTAAGKPTKIQISNSDVARLRARTEVHGTNTRMIGTGAAGTYALRLEGARPFLFTNCQFKSYDVLLSQPINNVRPFQFVGCIFESISGHILDAYYTGTDHAVHFTDCTFNSCAAVWDDPEVLNTRLRVTNCEFFSTTPQLDFVNQALAIATYAGGVYHGIPFTWQNPHNFSIILDRLVLQLNAAGGTPGAVFEVGRTQTNALFNDDIFQGVDLDPPAVPVLYDSLNATDAGATGENKAMIIDPQYGDYDWITGYVDGADASSMAGTVYIYYRRKR